MAILQRYVADLMPKPLHLGIRRYRALQSQKRVEKRLKKHRSDEKTIVHFLHIGKTGGTAIQYALRDVTPTKSYHIELRGHGFLLRDLPVGDKAVVFLRDPVSRFISAFNSIRTEGLPRYYQPLGPREKIAFKWFPTPLSLAKALSSNEVEVRRRARSAMKNIRFVNTSYWDWLGSPEYLEKRLDDFLYMSPLRKPISAAKVGNGAAGREARLDERTEGILQQSVCGIRDFRIVWQVE